MSSEEEDMMDGESDCEYDEDEMEYGDYYGTGGADDVVESDEDDPEAFYYEIISMQETKKLLDSTVCKVSKDLNVVESVARILLLRYKWDEHDLKSRFTENSNQILSDNQLIPSANLDSRQVSRASHCAVCFQKLARSSVLSLVCGHSFCKDCWAAYFEVQIHLGVTSRIECMNCNLLVGESIVLQIVKSPETTEKFLYFLLNEQVKTHPLLQWCPGKNCDVIIKAAECKAKKVICSKCESVFCFKCGELYHAPTDCYTIRKWILKCQDDSETANYIQGHTKDCPHCGVCIEKNGGCNHMQCYKCKHEFCWMCHQDWKQHGKEYYECSRYKANPNIQLESAGSKHAREALKKYLFYFERWQNHANSLQLEAETMKRINERIQEKVNNSVGTWIDWQYLLDAGALLSKCRYSMMYTYPYAYYMEGDRKKLFEYQQAQLELEIENLSWKLERADQYDRGDFENQMDIAEKRRRTLLKDFSAT